MSIIGVTGHRGFIGSNFVSYVQDRTKLHKIVKFHSDITKKKAVQTFVTKCDVVVHLAGKNRGTPQEVLDTNITGTYNVTDECHWAGKGLINAATSYDKRDAYLVGKTVSETIVKQYGGIGLKCINVKLPKVIGPGCKPFYNSFASTLCYLVAKGRNQEAETMVQNKDTILELVHVDDVCKWMYSFIDTFSQNGNFHAKEFEFYDPIRVTIGGFLDILNGKGIDGFDSDKSDKILETLTWYKENEISETH